MSRTAGFGTAGKATATDPGRVILRNAVSRLGAKAITYPLGFAASLLLVRYLGVERLGEYNYVSTFASLFGLLSGLGLPILLTREAARDKVGAARLLGSVLTLQLGLSAVTFLLVLGSGFALNPQRHGVLITLLGAGIAVNAIVAPYLAVLNAFELMHVTSALEVLNTAVYAVLVVAAVFLELELRTLIALCLVGPLTALLLTRLACHRYCIRPNFTLAPTDLRRLLFSTLPFALMVVFNTIYFRIDIVMLQRLQDEAAVGIYTAAYKLIDVLLAVGANIAGVLYPRLASQAAGAPHVLDRTIETAFRYMAALGVPIAVLVAVFAHQVIPLLFGEAFRPSIVPLRILIWAIPLIFMSLPFSHSLNATGHEWLWILVLCVNTVLNIGANLYTIPAWGAVGAALSTVGCELMGLVLLALFIRRVARVRYWTGMLPVLGAALPMGVAVWWLRDASLVGAGVFGLMVYGAGIASLGFFTRDERLALSHLFAPWRRSGIRKGGEVKGETR